MDSESTIAQIWLRQIIAKSPNQLSRFKQEVAGKRFRNPDTDNEVLFGSLPKQEQARIFSEWRRRQQGNEPPAEKERGLVRIDKKDARERATHIADSISKWLVRDPDERIGEKFTPAMGRGSITMGTVSIQDVRGRALERPLRVGVGKPNPQLWRAGRHFVSGGRVVTMHQGEDDPGTPRYVQVELNPNVTYGELAKNRDRVEQEVYSVLIHEMTHAHDVLETPRQNKKRLQKHKTPKDTSPALRDEAQNKEYYNKPSEVRAFKRQVVEEVRRQLEKHFKVVDFKRDLAQKKRDKGEDVFVDDDPDWIPMDADAVMNLLESSPTWDRVRGYLTPQNRRKLLESVASVVRKSKEDRGGKTATSAKTAKYNAKFLQWIKGQRFLKPETKNRVLFDSLPSEEQVRIFNLWSQMTQGDKAEEHARANMQLAPNKNPKRYEHIDVRFRIDEDEETLEDILNPLEGMFGTKDQNTLRDSILDLGGIGGVADLVHSVDITVMSEEDEEDAYVVVMGRGKDGLHFNRNLVYHHENSEYTPDYIDNSFFSSSPSAPPGVGTRMLASQVGAAEQAGFDRIETLAQRSKGKVPMNGYYTWPRLGYNAEFSDEDMEALEKDDPETAEQVRELADRDDYRMWPDAAAELSHVMMVPSAREWWEKNGQSVDAVFDVSRNHDGGIGYEVLRAYTEAKAIVEGKTIPEYLSKIGSSASPDLTPQDERILDQVWEHARARLQSASKQRVAATWLEKIAKETEVTFEAWVRGRRFRNPATGNMILFKSLKKPEQDKIRSQWGQGGNESEDSDPLSDFTKQDKQVLKEHLDEVAKSWSGGHLEDDKAVRAVSNLFWGVEATPQTQNLLLQGLVDRFEAQAHKSSNKGNAKEAEKYFTWAGDLQDKIEGKPKKKPKKKPIDDVRDEADKQRQQELSAESESIWKEVMALSRSKKTRFEREMHQEEGGRKLSRYIMNNTLPDDESALQILATQRVGSEGVIARGIKGLNSDQVANMFGFRPKEGQATVVEFDEGRWVQPSKGKASSWSGNAEVASEFAQNSGNTEGWDIVMVADTDDDNGHFVTIDYDSLQENEYGSEEDALYNRAFEDLAKRDRAKGLTEKNSVFLRLENADDIRNLEEEDLEELSPAERRELADAEEELNDSYHYAAESLQDEGVLADPTAYSFEEERLAVGPVNVARAYVFPADMGDVDRETLLRSLTEEMESGEIDEKGAGGIKMAEGKKTPKPRKGYKKKPRVDRFSVPASDVFETEETEDQVKKVAHTWLSNQVGSLSSKER